MTAQRSEAARRLCPSDERLAGFSSSSLAKDEAATIALHIDRCESCREVVGAIARQSAFVSHARGSRPNDGHTEEPCHVGEKLGRYTLVRRLGSGAMGWVFAGFDAKLDRLAAIKVLRDSQGISLRKEATALARIAAPNVVTIFEVGQDRGRDFIAMEYVDAFDFSEWLAARTRTLGEILQMLLELCEGLIAIHKEGLVHRDIKPENLLIGRDGRLRVSDFGLAAQSPTPAGEIAGTPLYMAPEQHRGQPFDGRADQFAFALTAAEALFGKHPIAATDVESIITAKEVGIQLPSRGEVPEAVKAVLRRALSPVPSERYDTMVELGRELRRAIELPSRLKKTVLIATLVLGAAIAALAVVLLTKPAGEVCADSRSALSTAWDASDRASLQAVAGGSDHLVLQLDRYAESWRSSYTRICKATLVAETQAPVLMNRRMQCLDEQRVALDTHVEQLRGGSEESLRRSWDLTADLPAPKSCEALALDGLQAMNATDRKSREGLVAGVAKISALTRAGDFSKAERLYQEVMTTRAKQYRYSLLANASLLGAQLADALELPEQSKLRREQALTLAEQADQQDLRVQVLASMLRSASADAKDLPRADALAPLCKAAGQASSSPRARALSFRALASHQNLHGNYGQAAELNQEALLLEDSELGKAKAQAELCHAWRIAGEFKKAINACEIAIGGYESLLDSEYPQVAVLYGNYSTALADAGRLPEAIEHLARAADMIDKSFGETHLRSVLIRRNLGSMQSDLGDHQASLQTYQHVLPRLQEAAGTRDPRVAALHTDIANELHILGKTDEAEAQIATALLLLAEFYPKGHPDRAMALLRQAELQGESGRWQTARDGARASLRMFEATLPPTHGDLVHVLYFLAQCESELGHKDTALGHLAAALKLKDLVPVVVELLKAEQTKILNK